MSATIPAAASPRETKETKLPAGPDPVLLVLSGLPGTGKSTIADALAGRRPFTVLAVDPIESAIVRAGIQPSFETGLAAYLVAEAIAEASLAAGRSVIIDAVNSVEPARDLWRELARRRGVPLVVAAVTVADEAAHRARVSERRRDLAIAEPGWDDVERRAREWTAWPEPHVALDGADDPQGNAERVLQAMDAARP
jgi:predicted kinase